MPELHAVADGSELAARAAELMRRAIDLAIAERGRAHVALSGGSTPGGAYRRLAQSGLDIERCRWFFVDERRVPPEHERSNFRGACRDLFEPAGIPGRHVFRMTDEGGASDYAAVLERELGPGGRLDLVIAGIGDDGHTASLFPGTGAVRLRGAVVEVSPGAGLEPRISLGRSAILGARRVLVLVSGAGKQAALARALATGDEDEVPARIYLAAPEGVVTYVVDRAALDSPADGR